MSDKRFSILQLLDDGNQTFMEKSRTFDKRSLTYSNCCLKYTHRRTGTTRLGGAVPCLPQKKLPEIF